MTQLGSGVCIAAVEGRLPNQLLDHLVGERQEAFDFQIDEIETNFYPQIERRSFHNTKTHTGRGKLDAASYLYSGLPWAADVPAAVGPPLSIHSNPTAIMAPIIGPAM